MTAMRFSLARMDDQGPIYVAACYEPQGDGLRFTRQWQDACSYTTVERACHVACALNAVHGDVFTVVENSQ